MVKIHVASDAIGTSARVGTELGDVGLVYGRNALENIKYVEKALNSLRPVADRLKSLISVA